MASRTGVWGTIGTGTPSTGFSKGNSNWTTPGSLLSPSTNTKFLCAWLDTEEGKASPKAFNAALGRNVSCFHFGQGIPLERDERAPLELLDGTDTDALLYLSLFPKQGLGAVTAPDLTDIVRTCVGLNLRGRRVLLRPAPDMNAPWNPWGMAPTDFKLFWKALYKELRSIPASNLTEVIWAPFEGSGYPFGGGPQSLVADFKSLDTNGDGIISEKDHPYAPFYPGDAFVDWVGLSVHYRGSSYPWTDIVLPRPGLLADLLTGQSVPATAKLSNFYKEYAEAKRKPFILAETGAVFHRPLAASDTGIANRQPSALEFKQAWWRQSFTNSTFFNQFPLLKALTLYEFVVSGSGHETGQQLDYSVSLSEDPQVWPSFVSDLITVESWYTFAQPWDSVTVVRDVLPSNGGPSFPSWVIALTLGLPFLVVSGWGLFVFWKKRKHGFDTTQNDMEDGSGADMQKCEELVDDTATVLNADGILGLESDCTADTPSPYPNPTLVDLDSDSRHATL